MNSEVLSQYKLKQWREDPVLFVQELFHVQPDSWQLEGLRTFPKQNRIAVKSAKGPGKTAFLAWIAWNFLLTRPYPKVVATSITADNLSDNLWPELSKWQNRSSILKELFHWTKTRIVYRNEPENWFLSARTWPKSGDPGQQADTLAGFHADYLLFILDESGGIPQAVAATAEAGLATGIETKIVQAGNPTHLEGPLYNACTNHRHLWKVIEITGDPEDPGRSSRIDVNWAKEQIEMYGRDNPWVLVNVFGQFPPSSINALLGPEEVNASMKRCVKEDEFNWAQKRLGVDVARFGDDRTIIFPRQGLVAFRPVVLRKLRTTDIAARVIKAKTDWESEIEFVDDTGHWGHGVIDNLMSAGYSPHAIQFHGPAMDPRFKNRRAEMWVKMSEWVKRGGALPNIPELVGELTVPTYTFVQGKFMMEDKDQIKQRLGRSPDLGDGLALTFALPDQPSQKGLYGFKVRKRTSQDWDPFEESRL